MSIFHKTVNEELVQHISDLERIDALTDEWYWDYQRVHDLDRIDEQLINNLLQLYKSRKSDREKFRQILQKLSKLHIILTTYMKKSKLDVVERRFVLIINRFVQEIEKLLDNFPLKIGITGYVEQRFDQQQALKFLRKAFDKIEKKYPKRTKEVVGKLIDAGIYAIAYREAIRRKWKTVGIPFSEFKRYRPFPVKEAIQLRGQNEHDLFKNMVDILVRIGGLYRARGECEEAKENNKEVYEYSVKADLSTIADMDAIHESRSSYIKKRRDIPKFVERPLLKACIILYDKNIHTLSTSANAKDIGQFAYINIEYDTLSTENKTIGEKYGQVVESDGKNLLTIKIPIQHPKVRVSEIKKRSLEIANTFKHQKMTWATRYTWEQLLQMYATTPEKAEEEGWTPETFSSFYYDSQEKIFYLSEEHYKKTKGIL